MLELIIFIVTTFAITSTITQEYIFRGFRKVFNRKPFNCSRCLSWWIGMIVGLFFTTIISPYISFFIYGAISYTSTRIIQGYLNDKEITILDE